MLNILILRQQILKMNVEKTFMMQTSQVTGYIYNTASSKKASTLSIQPSCTNTTSRALAYSEDKAHIVFCLTSSNVRKEVVY